MDLDPGVPLECRFSFVTLALTLIFSLMSITCIIWILVTICKVCTYRRNYNHMKSRECFEEIRPSSRSILQGKNL
ncbi:unnamed protein product [Heterobilharzia americana]|nr:unnamed protein product [Heterobilharzia americana]